MPTMTPQASRTCSACRTPIGDDDSTSLSIAASNWRFANGSGSGAALGLLGAHPAEHLLPQGKNEREAVVPLHPADRNTDELALGVQHAAPRDARMAVGEAGHQLVRRALPDVPGGDDDALRVVVPAPEDRVGKLELIAH